MTFRNYNDPEYKRWRKKVYARDNHQCQWPGCLSHKKLNAHHIKRWSDCPSLRFEISNGITLCKHHHKMISGLEHVYESIFSQMVARKDGRLQ